MLDIISEPLPYEFHDLKDTYKDELLQAKLDNKFIDRLFNAKEINSAKMPFTKLKKATIMLNAKSSNFNSLVKYRLKDGKGELFSNKQFLYDNNVKYLYLSNYSKEYLSLSSLKNINKIFTNIEEIEVENNKSIINFDLEDMNKVVDFFRHKFINFMTYRTTLLELSNFIKFIAKEYKSVGIEYEVKWNYKKLIKIIPDSEKPSPFLDGNEIARLAERSDVAQNGVVLILLLNGLRLSRIDENDEIRFLKESDVKDGVIHVHGKFPRDIKLTPREFSIVQDAIEEEYYDTKRNWLSTIPRTGYVLRPYGENKTTANLTEVGIQKRISNIASKFSDYIVERIFTYSSIRTAGRNRFIDGLVDLGYTLEEAAYLSLERFGDIKSDVDILQREKTESEYYMAYKIRKTYNKSKDNS
ncbi:hypothetical protein [Liquorilactobacillus mali]|uniref:Uncharacterized protein n=1 Tax=Liquorilactobacillus mali KCTC 3596 = DSM 20444 TaxID=1046596 RepID=A0A0R2E659_9LACO|nr:hypothetical protein [Liquorilactobacillus mali]KRN10779.1 hypothetical protein FD00_GL002021 [Liquorilactobacillus mali KCTC 3596 = DSM 20444]